MDIELDASGSCPRLARMAFVVLLGCASPGCLTEPGRARAGNGTPAASAQQALPSASEAQDAGPGTTGPPSPGDAAPAEPAQPAAAPPAAGASTAGAGAPAGLLHGSFATRYRGRFTSHDQDHDLASTLALDLADRAALWIRAHLLARASADLDGRHEAPVFQGLSDTYDAAVVPRLDSAYVDLALGAEPARAPGTLRIGRQTDPRLPEVLRLDGVSFRSRALGTDAVELGAYGGVPAHVYAAAHRGDRACGTFVEAQPWQGGRVRFDWMHLEDEVLLGPQRDDLLALGLWQHVADFGWLEGTLTRLEGADRDLSLRALYEDPDSDTTARLSYYELLQTQTTSTLELDPFSEALLDSFPFRQVTLDLSRPLGEHTALDLGCDVRRVRDASDVGEFNRDWQRFYATATLRDALVDGLAFSLTTDRWDGEGRDVGSLGADLSYASDGPWEASLGTYYSLFKYELLELRERDDVRTYYLRTSYAFGKSLRLEFGYDLENDDLHTYHTLRLGTLWRF